MLFLLFVKMHHAIEYRTTPRTTCCFIAYRYNNQVFFIVVGLIASYQVVRKPLFPFVFSLLLSLSFSLSLAFPLPFVIPKWTIVIPLGPYLFFSKNRRPKTSASLECKSRFRSTGNHRINSEGGISSNSGLTRGRPAGWLSGRGLPLNQHQ